MRLVGLGGLGGLVGSTACVARELALVEEASLTWPSCGEVLLGMEELACVEKVTSLRAADGLSFHRSLTPPPVPLPPPLAVVAVAGSSAELPAGKKELPPTTATLPIERYTQRPGGEEDLTAGSEEEEAPRQIEVGDT